LFLFWVGRDDVGSARITWRRAESRRVFELLIGTDPERAPRKINRWGFITETLSTDRAEILGVMKESGEQTIEEAEARITLENGGLVLFKASRSTVTNGTAVGGTLDLRVPAHLTYRDLDTVLALIPAKLAATRTLELPPGTERGFLVALDTLIERSIEPCRRAGRPDAVPAVRYVYNQTLYDLTLRSCHYRDELRSRVGVFTEVVDGRFEIENRSTGKETRFRVMYGASGDRRGVPVRALFRPHWWIEVELLLDSADASLREGR
jgi:hypothetical protein